MRPLVKRYPSGSRRLKSGRTCLFRQRKEWRQAAEPAYWCTVRPYSKMMIIKLCNILLWIGNNYYKTAAELHYITFSMIIQWFLMPVPLLLDGLVFPLVKNASLRKKYFSLIKSRFVKKVSGHHPLPLEFFKCTQNFALYGVLHLIKFRKLIW